MGLEVGDLEPVKVYVLEAPHTTLAVASTKRRALAWRDRIREDPDGPPVAVYSFDVDDPPPVVREGEGSP